MALDPGIGPGAAGHALYVGRLSVEKGVEMLVRAWTRDDVPCELHIIGEDPSRV
jgi:hypothetical protein